jgi:hypothetical protein
VAEDSAASIASDCVIPSGVKLEAGVQVGTRTLFAGANILVGQGAVIEPACVIADGVTIGRGALIRAGAVVLRSIPPNAIAEGNPCEIVGYRASGNSGDKGRPQPRLTDAARFADMPRPTSIPLGVGDGALYLMRRVTDARGALTVGEVPTEVPFAPARYFAVFDVPSAELRGEHAHKLCQQFLICLHGSCRVMLDDGVERCEVTLDRPDMGVFMPAMIWGTQYRYSRDAVLLVFASRPYEAEDYIKDYDEFLVELNRPRP